jgi:hypothetical protein
MSNEIKRTLTLLTALLLANMRPMLFARAPQPSADDPKPSSAICTALQNVSRLYG